MDVQDKHQVYEFLVVEEIASDVILGDELLSTTETLTKHVRRLRTVYHRTTAGKISLNLISRDNGRQRYMIGELNGKEASVIPDTGADTAFMSKVYAESRGFKIGTAKRSRTTVSYADGSHERTLGIVRNVEWSYGGTVRRVDLQVLANPTFEVLLDANTLLATDAFTELETVSRIEKVPSLDPIPTEKDSEIDVGTDQRVVSETEMDPDPDPVLLEEIVYCFLNLITTIGL